MAYVKSSSEIERFMSHVEKSSSGCWHWTAYRMKNGYGKFRTPTCGELAHRASYRLFVGPLDLRDVMHSCDNPACVNPKHLSLGTRTDNMQDASRKGRTARGEKHGRAKITENEVCLIRTSVGLQREIAARFGISQSHVSDIQRGVKWA